MTIFHLTLFLFLIIGPVALAWFKGDQLIEYFSRGQRKRKMHKRQRATKALPVRETVINSLLFSEDQCNKIDEKISEALNLFHQTTENGRAFIAHHMALGELDAIEQLVLSRESRFGDFLDIAQLQSETIEILTRKVDMLRETARLDTVTPPVIRTQAAAKLMANLNRAVQKRRQIDRKLTNIGSPKTETGSTSRFDITIE
jgi:hypothetical protein